MRRRCTAAQGGRAMTGATRRITMIVLVLAVCAGPWGCAVKRPPVPQSPSEAVRAQLNTIGLPVAGFAPETQLDAPTSGKGMGALKGAGFGLAAGATPGLAIANAVGKGCGGGREIGALVCGAVLGFGRGEGAAGGPGRGDGGAGDAEGVAAGGGKSERAQSAPDKARIQTNVPACRVAPQFHKTPDA